MSTNDIRETFFLECEDLLEALEEGLQDINDQSADGAVDSECINAVFRAVHSIKGGAGAFKLDELVHFAHTFETVLDEVRNGKLLPDSDVMGVFFRANDRLVDLVNAARDEEPVDPADNAAIEAELNKYAPAEEEEVDAGDYTPMGLSFDFELPDLDDLDLGPAKTQIGYEIHFRPFDQLYGNGNDAAHLIRALSELGVVTAEVDTSGLPAFETMRATGACLSWKITLMTDESEHVVLDVFDFVDGLCELTVDPIYEEADTPVDDDGDTGAGEELEMADFPEDDAPEATAAAPDLPMASAVEPADAAEPRSAAKQESGQAAAKTTKATIRVDLERVDRLINVVGELVINQAMLSQCAKEAGVGSGTEIAAGLDEFKQLSREIQESVMAIRAQPVKSLFQRMSRIVREASHATGKTVKLITQGEATEVDKTVIERLADPLTHMIRNAVDHGLEKTEKRLENGKDKVGHVTLTAAHRSGRVFIEVSDDGAGINRERVLQIGIEKGIVDPSADLSDTEIDNLIFAPGFSTASEISDLSGRGVGMDVVKSSIQSLGGRVTINSTPGKGSVFTISLPLTLAVMEGMVVQVAGQTMIVPLTAIVETLRPEREEIHMLGTGDEVVSVRGMFLPVVDLAASFGYRSAQPYTSSQVLLLVNTDDDHTYALTVDAIHDQRQVVIKGLKENYGDLTGIAAATILGDGRIALIIDTDAIYEQNTAQPTLMTYQPNAMGASQ
ncbi:two-component system, chemotaxis family, sensor kinase CheA [Poseidonocella pacifica]|uniref:Chemotaxis protein CheA n=1 Tax=Poseidonocella pacifica TaxID=871651 RepID=A0A1I0VF38_9RHOB|nr:chemotaxis protein CheA [Poseidonocella pacifica]SFA74902.1 two-component system, chemotaxis family, sensor kinase CheA [Poseidonocella pacifica]